MTEDKDLSTTRQRVIGVGVFAFCAGIEFAFGLAHYRRSATDFNYISDFLVCVGFLIGTVVQASFIWAKLKQVESH